MTRTPERGRRHGPKDAAHGAKHTPCALCRDKVDWVDYKDVASLRRSLNERGKIRARRVTGNCDLHQQAVALAIRTAREMVLLPYTTHTTTERSGGRGRPGARSPAGGGG